MARPCMNIGPRNHMRLLTAIILYICLLSRVLGAPDDVEEEVKDASAQNEMVRKEARKWRQTSTALNDLLLYGYNARLLLNATLAHLDTYAADRVLTGPVPPCMTGACRPPGRHDPTVFADRHEVTFATTNDKYAELCPSRSGDFRHPTDRQKFYRCNEFYYTLEDCGDGFYFDSTRRFCLPYAKAATSVERDMEALLPKEETDTSTNGSVTTMHGTAGWLCAEDRLPAGRQWDLSRAGVSGCWAEALRRRARHLAVGLSGCLYGDLTSLVTGGPCSNRSLHVIDVQQHQKQISKLRPGAKLWITGSDLDGIQWVPVNLNGPATLRTCTEACVEQGAGFSRVDHQGCRCGLSSGPTSITTALPVWRDALPAAVTPAIILSLWLRLPRGASCSPGAASVAEDPTAVQGTIDFCESRRRKNYTTGGPLFHCSAESMTRLGHARRSQCEMKPKSVTRSQTVDGFRLTSQRRVTVPRTSRAKDFKLFWVQERPKNINWTTSGYFLTIDECLRNCSQQITLIGKSSCLCGSLPDRNSSWNALEWMAGQKNLTLSRGQGFLLHDKGALNNVPEGWMCSTKPESWIRHPSTSELASCITICNDTENSFAAFGKSGCFCGNSTEASSRPQLLPIESCQEPLASIEAYIILSVDIWIRNIRSLQSRDGYSASLVSAPPAGVQWRPEPGCTTLLDCFWSCNARTGVTFILLGVEGCRCGSIAADSAIEPSRKWRLDNAGIPPSRGFFLIQRSKPSTGRKYPSFEWKHRFQDGVLKNETYRNMSQPWIQDEASSDSPTSGGGPQNITFNGESTDSKERHRRLSVSVADEQVARDTRGQNSYVISKTFLTGPKKNLVQETASENITLSTESAYVGNPKYLAFGKRRKQRNISHSKVTADDSGIRSHVARSKVSDLCVTRRRQKNVDNGTPLVVEPAVNGTCHAGPANRTMWTAVSSPASDALQCLCMCMEKEHLLTAILESGRCYCAPGASQLGNVTAQTTWPAACPAGADRVSFSVSQHVEALMQYCRYSPHTGRKSLRIGDTGKYTQVTFSVFDNIAMTRIASSESNVAALHTGRNVLGRTSTVQTIHQKKGTLATTRECNLRKGPTGWDFHLEVLETSTVDYIERFELSKKDAMKKRTYERISIFL